MLAHRPGAARRPVAPSTRVRVKGGYDPPIVHGRVGEPLRVVFSREETASCSEHVVFPAFGLSAMLPPYEDVALDLLPERAGAYEFTCQLGMLRGVLVVEEASADRVTAGVPTVEWRHAVRYGALLVAALFALAVLLALLA